MTRPRAPYVPPVPDEDEDIHPAELRRLEKLFFARVDHMIAAFERKRRAAGLDADPSFISDS